MKKRIEIFVVLAMVLCLIFTGCGQAGKTDVNTNNDVNDTNPDSNSNQQQLQVQNDYFVLYDGREIELKSGVQELSDISINDDSTAKYNTKYYNYENGKYAGESEGALTETYDGYAVVDNVKRIAVSQKYDAIPRTYTVINDLPKELNDMADCSSVDIHSVDLDGDGKTEYVVCYTVNYAEGEIGNGEPQASSGIMLFDSEYKKIADLVSLENGFWGNIKKEDNKVFLSLNDVDYVDIDNDSVMEILIKVPTYEGSKISIVKYNDGNIEGETNLNASVLP